MDEMTLPDKPAGGEIAKAASLLIPVTVACGSLMSSLDQNVVVTALPAIGRSLGEPPSQLGLVITSYVASLIISMPIGGWAATRFGLRPCYCVAVLVFGLASILCGAASAPWMLFAARGLQGFGGALMGTLGQVVMLSSFPRERTLKINTFIALANQMGLLLGPLVGGALTTYLSWRWIFFINVPLACGASIAARVFFPAQVATRRVRFDLPGFFLVAAGMAMLVYGMDALGRNSGPGWTAGTELAVAITILAIATAYFLVVPQPLLDIRLLRIRTFRVSFLTGGGVDTITLSAVLFLLPLLFQEGFGLTAVQSGSITFAAAVGSVLVRVTMPRLLRRFGFRSVLVCNTPLIAAIAAGFALFHAGMPYWIAVAYIFAFGMFRAIQWSSSGNLAYADIGQEELAHFSALYYILAQLGVAIGIGLASALLSLLSRQERHASVGDFRILFVVEGVATLAALFGYLSLKPEDGTNVSGHRMRGTARD